MRYTKGDIIYIKPISWYNENKDENGEIKYLGGRFSVGMKVYCGQKTMIKNVYNGIYTTDLGHNIPIYEWMIDMYSTDRMKDARQKEITIQLDQNLVDKINLPIDSNEKYLNKEFSYINSELESSSKKSLVSDLPKNDYSKNIVTKDMKRKKLKIDSKLTELKLGTAVIGTDKTKIPFYFGYYEGRAGRGYYKVRVNESTVINCASISIYNEDTIIQKIKLKFEEANKLAKYNEELKSEIIKLIEDHNKKYGTNLTAELH